MPKRLQRHRCRQLGILALTVSLLADQFSKWYVLDQMQLIDPVRITSFFNLVMVWNPGISFGMLGDLSIGGETVSAPMLLSLTAGLLCLILFLWMRYTHSRLVAAGLGMVIGGAIGNIIDRIRFGAVADFFDFHINGHHWPAFNIADSAIFIGVVLLVWDSIVGAPPNLPRETE